MSIESFLQNKKPLFWYVKDIHRLSDNAIIEGVLNYGDWQDVQDMIEVFGIQKISDIFTQDIQKSRNNYRPEIVNYFQLYFQKYAE